MTPLAKFKRTIKYMRLAAGYCGADVFDKNYKISFRTILVFGCIFSYFGFTIYTCNIKVSEDWGVGLETLCMFGSVTEGLSKLISGIVYSKLLIEHIAFIQSIYADYAQKSQKYYNVLEKSIYKLNTLFKVLILNSFVFILVMCSTPIMFLIFTGKRTFCMQFLIPGINPDTTTGYYITLSIQYFYFGFGIVGNLAADLAFALFIIHFFIISDVFALKVEDLNEILQKEHNNNEEIVLKDILKDIAFWHQKYIKYKSSISQIFFWIIFIQIGSSTFSMTLTLYVIVAGEWQGAYAYFCFNFIILITYCCLGTIVEFTNSKIIMSLEEISWYYLSISHQKMLQIMLVNAQIQDLISIGGLAPLSANTGLQVLKTIYSYFMLLRQFLID